MHHTADFSWQHICMGGNDNLYALNKVDKLDALLGYTGAQELGGT
jgi:hypothetical protein